MKCNVCISAIQLFYIDISRSCQKVCDTLVYLLDNIFIRFGTKLYRQTIGILMGTNYAPLVADLFLVLFCFVFCF